MIGRLVRPVLGTALAIGILLGSVPATAQLMDEEQVGRLTVGLGIGALAPGMGDVNDNFSTVNRFLNRAEIRGLDKIRVGLVTSLDVRYRLGRTPPEDPETVTGFKDRVTLGFAWGAINTKSAFDVQRVGVRFFSRATTYNPYVLYHFPWIEPVAPQVQLYAGGGPLLLQSGHTEWILQDRTTGNGFLDEGDISELAGRVEASATGLGFNALIGGSFQLNSRFSVAVDIGYRRARLSDLELTSVEDQDNLRFTTNPNDPANQIVRRPGVWGVIDFFRRDPGASFDTDGDGETEQRSSDPACQNCNDPYYTGGDLDVDFSGPYSTFSFRVHLF